MRNKWGKRSFALVLVLAMVFSLLGNVSVYAQAGQEESSWDAGYYSAADINEANYIEHQWIMQTGETTVYFAYKTEALAIETGEDGSPVLYEYDEDPN